MIQVILSVVIVLVGFVISLEYVLRQSSHYKAFIKLKGPGPYLPVIGNLLEVLLFSSVSGFQITRDNARRFKNGYAYYGMGQLYYKLYTAENCEKMCNVNNTKKNFFYGFLTPFIHDGLLKSFGPKWLKRRKMLTPTFHFNILKQHLKVISEECNKLIDEIKENQSSNGYIDLVDIIPKLTLNIISEAAMGVKIESLGLDNARNYRKNIQTIGDILQHRFFSPHLHYDFAYWLSGRMRKLIEFAKPVHAFTAKIIRERRVMSQSTESRISQDVDNDNIYLNKKPRFALLDTLFEAQRNGNQIDDAGIQEEVDTFVFTGFDTVSVALEYTIMAIANHPEHQQRLYEEISNALENNKNEPLQVPQYATLEFLDRFLKEVLRLFPSAPFVARNLIEELEINGVVLPVGTSVHMMFFDLHRDPEHFPDPLRFDPDRFLPELVEKRHPFAYLPFSAGPRNCIGQKFAVLQLKTAIITILTNFKLEAITKMEDLVFIVDLTLHTNHPIKVKFVPRSIKK